MVDKICQVLKVVMYNAIPELFAFKKHSLLLHHEVDEAILVND